MGDFALARLLSIYMKLFFFFKYLHMKLTMSLSSELTSLNLSDML